MDIVNDGPRRGKTMKSDGGSDEAARLFPQRSGIPGQDRAEPQGFADRSPAASSSQGRTMRAGLSRDQPAGTGADAGGRRRRGADPVAGDHRMAGRDLSRSAAAAKGSAAPRQGARVRHGARLRYASRAKSQGS